MRRFALAPLFLAAVLAGPTGYSGVRSALAQTSDGRPVVVSPWRAVGLQSAENPTAPGGAVLAEPPPPGGAATVAGPSAWYEGFEGSEPTWRQAGGDADYRLLRQERIRQGARTGQSCEWMSVQADGGTRAYMLHPVGPARLIDELLPTLWVHSDRPGIQLFARVVLPRTPDPRTGQPASVLLPGTSYTSVGRWQQLRVDGLIDALERQTRTLRAQTRTAIDPREAYLDAVALNVFGGPGVTNVCTDDLDLAGYVRAEVAGRVAAQATGPALPPPSTFHGADDAPARPSVKLTGSVLLVGDRPLFPRMVQYRGEPLDWLARLGFNGVWLTGRPSPDVLREARRLGLWLVCPPPFPPRDESAETAAVPLPAIGPEYDAVLAWDLGAGLARRQLASTARWAEDVRSADRAVGRPLLCGAQANLLEYSRQADVLLLDRRPLATSLELADYATWVEGQPRLARPGTPVWTTVQTQPAEALRRQWAAMAPGRAPPTSVSSEQVRLLAYTALGSGSRGLLFLSDSSLAADDPDTRFRAATLELLNLELTLLEPWAASGTYLTVATTAQPQVRAAVFRTDRSRLALPVWLDPGAQWVVPPSAANSFWIVVPGAPESAGAYDLTSAGMQSLRHKRVAGGMQIAWDEFALAGGVLLAQDPLVVNTLSRQTSVAARRVAELQRQLAVQRFHVVRETLGRIEGRPSPTPQRDQWMADARQALQQCDAQLTGGDFPSAYTASRRAARMLRLVERATWEAAVEGIGSPAGNPAAASFATLPAHWDFLDRLRSLRSNGNRLPGGDFEDLGQMLQAGWQHLQQPVEGLATEADLAVGAARSGRTGLRLSVQPLRAAEPDEERAAGSGPFADPGPKGPPAILETPPAWITTPPVHVEPGSLVCIHGWVQAPAPIVGSVDGLMIFDSHTGPDMAERIGQTQGWRQFVLYRVATESIPIRVTLALSGMGEVWIDDLSVEVLGPYAAVPAAAARPADSAPPR